MNLIIIPSSQSLHIWSVTLDQFFRITDFVDEQEKIGATYKNLLKRVNSFLHSMTKHGPMIAISMCYSTVNGLLGEESEKTNIFYLGKSNYKPKITIDI